MTTLLDERQFGEWIRDGYLLLKGFYDRELEILPIQREIYKLISRVGDRLGKTIQEKHFSADTFDDGLQLLLRDHPDEAALVYDTVKKLPSYVSLTCSEKHFTLARKLLGSDMVAFAPRGYGMRMDHPYSDKYITQLHQDYTSQLGSPRGVVFWSPLRRVDRALGPVILFPGSHRLGILPINLVGNDSYGLQLHDERELRTQFRQTSLEVETGDLLIADYLLLHESSPNRSTKTRWAMIARFFDLNEDIGMGYGWKGGLADGNSFADVHPNLIRVREV